MTPTVVINFFCQCVLFNNHQTI